MGAGPRQKGSAAPARSADMRGDVRGPRLPPLVIGGNSCFITLGLQAGASRDKRTWTFGVCMGVRTEKDGAKGGSAALHICAHPVLCCTVHLHLTHS